MPLRFVLFALLVWPLAAFGGRAASTAVPFGLTCLALAIFLKSQLGGRLGSQLGGRLGPRSGGRLDGALVGMLALIALQVVPLPASIVALVSPHAALVGSALSIDGRAPSAFRPLTISASDTGWAWIVTAGATAFFWMARAQFGRGGVRRTVRMVSALGFAVSLLAIAQAATAGRDVYWRFRTEFEGPLPFGPFINRNHFATWVIMALPLCLGYIAARSGARAKQPGHTATRTRLAHAIDPRTAWLMAAGVTMLLALLLSLSRSGVLALGVSAAGTVMLCRHRLDRRRRRRVMATAAIVVVCGLAWADIPALRERVAGAQTGVANRLTIWRETVPIVGDFWLTGTGAGTYQRAMLGYQRSSRTVYFNQAHNHYLQVAAEGGLLLVGIVMVVLAAFVRTARARLMSDASGLFWIRAGAVCGLGAVALQSVWETGLVMPANASLAALLAALIIHERLDDQ
jgi:putative inorganic carbon (HCO3(-)) transporter